MTRLSLALLLCLTACSPLAHAHPLAQGGTVSASYMQTFDGMPPAPTAYRPPGWDVQYHHRDITTWTQGMDNPIASHGPACEAPNDADPRDPAHTHDTGATVEADMYQCHDHLMTSSYEGGYGLLTFTPPALLDWSRGPATLDFDLSTYNFGSDRDLPDVFLTPWADVLTLPVAAAPDLAGPPWNALRFGLHSTSPVQTIMDAQQYVAGTALELPYNGAVSLNDGALAPHGLQASSVRRDAFEVQVSATHVKYWMPAYNWVALDADLPTPLPYTQAVVQFGHHSYNPDKSCLENGTCGPNTWHWDNVRLSPAVPFTIEPASPRDVGGPGWPAPETTGPFTWTTPAAAGAELHFSSAGGTYPDVSWDGATWQRVTPVPAQNTLVTEGSDHAQSYTVPVPLGARQAWVRSTGGYWSCCTWYAVDAHVWTPPLGDRATPLPTAAPTPAPTATPTARPTGVPPTGTPVATATLAPTHTALATATPTPVASLPPPDPSRPCQVPVARFGVLTWKDAPTSSCR